jgi:hypothetical protein
MSRRVRLLVTLDLAVRRGAVTERLRAVHALAGDEVEASVTAGGGATSRRIPLSDWAAELERTCLVRIPAPAPAPPPDGPGLPWDLVVGTGAALAGHRTDLFDELVGRAEDLHRDQVRQWHRATLGRLRVVGVLPSRRVGRVSWFLVADGWRALTPYLAGGTAMLRLERRRPEDLPVDIARWAAEVAR